MAEGAKKVAERGFLELVSRKTISLMLSVMLQDELVRQVV